MSLGMNKEDPQMRKKGYEEYFKWLQRGMGRENRGIFNETERQGLLISEAAKAVG